MYVCEGGWTQESREVAEIGKGIKPVKFVSSNQLLLWKAGAQVWWGNSRRPWEHYPKLSQLSHEEAKVFILQIPFHLWPRDTTGDNNSPAPWLFLNTGQLFSFLWSGKTFLCRFCSRSLCFVKVSAKTYGCCTENVCYKQELQNICQIFHVWIVMFFWWTPGWLLTMW